MDGFVVAVKKPVSIPSVTKASLKKYLLEYIIDSDLVCAYILTFCCWGVSLTLSFQSFRSIERPLFLCLIHYLCPKLNVSDILKCTCMGDMVMDKVDTLDKIDLDLVTSIDSLVSIVYDGWSSK
jgi:hypothetical protein